MEAKLIAAAIAIVAVLAIVGGFYLFLEHQVTVAYQTGAAAAHADDAAASAKAAIDERNAEIAARDAAQKATNDRLAELARQQAENAQRFDATLGQMVKHDIGKDARAHPRLVADIFNRGTVRTLRLLECASGAAGRCAEAAAAGAQARPGPAGAAGAAADHVGRAH